MRKCITWALVAIIGAGLTVSVIPLARAEKPKSYVREMHFELYQPQKVIYHVTESGGWFDRDYVHLLTVAKNHMNAVGEGSLDLRIVLQGNGVDLLVDAKKNAKIATAIDKLRAQGVRFEVCRNTLIARDLDPDLDLYNVGRQDIVSAGIAEVAALQAQGYVYLKP